MPRFSLKTYIENGGEIQDAEIDGKIGIYAFGDVDKLFTYKLGGKMHKWLMRRNEVDAEEYGFQVQGNKVRNVWRNKERQLVNNLRSLRDRNDFTTLEININDMSVERISYLISKTLPVSNQDRVFSIGFNDTDFFVYNNNIKNTMTSAFLNSFVVEGDEIGSDQQVILNLYQSDRIVIRKRIPQNILNELGGEFFKHINLTKMNLTEYGVFNENEYKIAIKQKYFNHNCLFHAIINAEKHNTRLTPHFKKSKLMESLKIFLNNTFIPRKKLKKIFEPLELNVDLKYMRKKNCSYTEKFRYGGDKKVLCIGLLDNHYFSNTRTKYSLYDICKETKFVKLDSFEVIRKMLKTKNVLRDLTFNEQIETPFFKDSDLVSIKDEIILTRRREVKAIKDKYKDYKKIFFDVETITNGDVHKVYMCDAVDDKDRVYKFDGYDCCKRFLHSFTENLLLIAHNASYDTNFIIPYMFGCSGIFKGTRSIGVKGYYIGKNGKKYKVCIKDSYNLISAPLRKFGKMFNLKTHKEFMPYSLYTDDVVKNNMVLISKAMELCKTEEDKEVFLKNIKKWKLQDGEYFNAMEYSHKYCIIDCVVLRDGYNTFSDWIFEGLNIDMDNILTSASLAQKYMEQETCFEGVCEIGGAYRAFIQKCVVGGRTMTRQNKKWFVNKKLADYDAVSLYPSAMERLGLNGGYLKGKPKPLTNLTMEFLNKVDGYFIKIRFNNDMNKKYAFPLVSVKNKLGVRKFTNKVKGQEMYVDKISLEDIMFFHKLNEDDFTILEGCYFNEGRNARIYKVIRKIFNLRLEMKAQKNPAQAIYKLIMNSAYGKTLLNPYSKEVVIKDTDEEKEKYVCKNFNHIEKVIKMLNTDKYIIKQNVPIIDHYNYAHVGCEILSMSKRIMNEVMCMAEDNNINIYYQDTDSMHIEFEKVPVLEKLYRDFYKKELNGKDMGQFHVDFESDILKGEIFSSKFIGLGKKCYIDVLEDGSGKKDYHYRMKGVSHSTVKYTADKMNMKLDELYEFNLKNKVKYDLLEGGNKCRFVRNENMSVSMAKNFERTLRFGGELIIV